MLSRQMQNAYGRSALETEVSVASPHKLILMLYDGALQAIRMAKIPMQEKRYADKGKLISKSIAIIDDGLRASLNTEVGGELAQNLDALYEYCSQRLLQANLKNDVALLDEVEALLIELREAWAGIQPAAATPQAPAAPASTPGRGPMSYGEA